MGRKPTKAAGNPFCQARLRAAERDYRLFSKEKAAELLDCSESTLQDYELGLTKNIPPDMVIKMADLYGAPELCNMFCKTQCPIGKDLPVATSQRPIEGIALRLIREFDLDRIKDLERSLVEIAEDGRISEDEVPDLKEILKSLDRLSEVISEMRIVGKTLLKVKEV